MNRDTNPKAQTPRGTARKPRPIINILPALKGLSSPTNVAYSAATVFMCGNARPLGMM
ncbi:hypothetical protein [Brevundimonas sp. ZS04]|uniref:hypothetical protein n=1 Tax=Brevundimonas sp. ZS04 TaxID=1906854 RepID=UPI0018E9517A|nr:hypothetical protein [Brevundimonas sp. ZS04]